MLLGDIIKQYREKHQMSLQNFAELVHTSRSYIHMLEKNFNPATGKPISPSVETLKSIAHAMNIDLEDLLKQLDAEQNIYLDETAYLKQFSDECSDNDFRYASHNGINTDGLDENDIEEINRFVEFIKNKKKNGDK